MDAYIYNIRKRKDQLEQKDQKMSKSEKFVEVKTKKHTYNVPEKYAQLSSVSAIIRAMLADGFSRWQVHKQTGILYQHVRNVAITPLAK